MTALPPAVDFTDADTTEGDFKTAISNMRAYLAGLLGTDGTTSTARTTLEIVTFPTGTRMAFNQTSAPSGWTKDTTSSLNDSIIRIVTGTVGSGGTTAFSTFNAQTVTGSHTLTVAEMPAHTHGVFVYPGGQTGGGSNLVFNSGGTLPTTSTGSGGGHTHGLTHGIKYNDFIIASKD